MYVLDKLWRGKLSPNEPCCHYGSEYSNLRDIWIHKGKLISAELSEEGKKLFQEYQDLQERLTAEDWELFTRYQDAERGAGVIADADIFIEGFRMGARVILDVLLKTA